MSADDSAFPHSDRTDWIHHGLTKREYAAIECMKGILANPVRWQQIKDKYEAGEIDYDGATAKNVSKAIHIADALLTALEEE